VLPLLSFVGKFAREVLLPYYYFYLGLLHEILFSVNSVNLETLIFLDVRADGTIKVPPITFPTNI